MSGQHSLSNWRIFSIVLSKLIPRVDMHRLSQFYSGKKCILTLSSNRRTVQWINLIPHSSRTQGITLEKLKRLKLCREDLVPTSSENLIPLDRNHYYLFDTMRWGLFPAISVLRKYIYNEELWWRYRELAFRERGIDVGRPPFIGSSNRSHVINAFPPVKLIAGISNVVITCTPHLANILKPGLPTLTPHTRDALDLGVYLQALWDRTPNDNQEAPRRPAILPKWDFDHVAPDQAPSLPSTAPQSQTSPQLPSSHASQVCPPQQQRVVPGPKSQGAEAGSALHVPESEEVEWVPDGPDAYETDDDLQSLRWTELRAKAEQYWLGDAPASIFLPASTADDAKTRSAK